MSQLIIFLLGIIVGVAVMRIVDSRLRGNDRTGNAINPQQQETRRKNLEKVMEMARQKGEIANDIIEKVLGVSNATAERYLQELEFQGKLEQIGKTGKFVTYRPR